MTTCAEKMHDKVCQKRRRAAPPFLDNLEKTGGGSPQPPSRAKDNKHRSAKALLWKTKTIRTFGADNADKQIVLVLVQHSSIISFDPRPVHITNDRKRMRQKRATGKIWQGRSLFSIVYRPAVWTTDCPPMLSAMALFTPPVFDRSLCAPAR